MAKSMSLEIFNSKKFSCDDYFFQKFDKWLWSIDNFISFKKIENWIFLITPERRFQFYIRIKERTSRPRSFIFRNGIDGMKNIRRSHSDQSLEIHQKNPYSFNWNVYIYIYIPLCLHGRGISRNMEDTVRLFTLSVSSLIFASTMLYFQWYFAVNK